MIKRITQVLVALLLISFSFYYTNKTIELIRKTDPIMQEIKENKDKFIVAPEDAKIEEDKIIPGKKGMEIDYDRRIVSIKHQEIKLTQTEYNIVTLLSEHAGRVLTYAFIIHAIWGSADSGSIKKLQVNMANIRKKLGSKPGDNQYISNELGVGYRMYGNE